jgi:hypothetical protein
VEVEVESSVELDRDNTTFDAFSSTILGEIKKRKSYGLIRKAEKI